MSRNHDSTPSKHSSNVLTSHGFVPLSPDSGLVSSPPNRISRFTYPIHDTTNDNDDDNDSSILTAVSSQYHAPKNYDPDIPLRKLSKPKGTSNKLGHKPVPAKTVFSRNAAPLYLPWLDDHLSQIQSPDMDLIIHSSSEIDHNDKGKKPSQKEDDMFPPFQLLKGKTLDELRHNSGLPPFYKDKSTILSSITNVVLGVAGSSMFANYYNLQGLYDGVQIFALILTSVVPSSSIPESDKWRKLFLSTIPNILALNIPTKLTQSLIFLSVFMAISGLLLYRFHVLTSSYSPSISREGLQARHPSPAWSAIFISFFLTVLYLPLSTIAVHGIIWSSDFWVVPNPYVNGTSPVKVAPLGPSNIWRDPMDFCFTSTMRKDEVNIAPVIVVFSVITFIFMTIWFPIRLMKTIKESLPHVDPYTELGEKRSQPEMELEYLRLLDRDQNPFAFFYKDFRRRWGSYKAIYLWAKLSALLIVAILSPDNCAFRSFNRSAIDIVRQSVLTTSMLVWFLLQVFLVPFVDPVSNASEWTSRANYLITSAIGLGVALRVPGSKILNGIILYIIYVVTYGLSIYFSIIGTSFIKRTVKRLSRRIDFSIDIFSPKLDLSPNSPHIRRRIWQESLGVLILTDPLCRIPAKHQIAFAEAQKFSWPPYLLDFQGTPGERHVENLKILREVGLKPYVRAASLFTGPEGKLFDHLQRNIVEKHVGPDSFWRPLAQKAGHGDKRYFGNAWWVPFPPTLVIEYDSGGRAILNNLNEFESYISQNEDPFLRAKRKLRKALRALDKQIVTWPYTHVELVGSRKWFSGRQYSMQSTTHFHSCVFEIKRRGLQFWEEVPLGSGFDVQMTYSKNVKLDGDAIGINDDFELTPTLAKFLYMNRHLINLHSERLHAALHEYRVFCKEEARKKRETLSYQFLTEVYLWTSSPKEVSEVVEELEIDLRVRQLFVKSQHVIHAMDRRMHTVSRSEVTIWWYLFWDDFWRKNHDTIRNLRKYEPDFNPHFGSSIAYKPLPRPALEAFLVQRGLFLSKVKFWHTLHNGFLNKLYFRLNQIIFHNTDKAIPIHVGHAIPEIDLEDLVLTTHVRSSTIGTGGGTDHDDASIRPRPAYRWEEVFDDPIQQGNGGSVSQRLSWRRWKAMIAIWFGITPLDRRRLRTNGIAFDVRLDYLGRYVILKSPQT